MARKGNEHETKASDEAEERDEAEESGEKEESDDEEEISWETFENYEKATSVGTETSLVGTSDEEETYSSSLISNPKD